MLRLYLSSSWCQAIIDDSSTSVININISISISIRIITAKAKCGLLLQICPATEWWSSVVCASVCWAPSCVMQNGWSDREAVRGWERGCGYSCGPKECIRSGPNPPKGKHNFWGLSRSLKSIESLMRSTQQKISNGISATAAADCIPHDWLCLINFLPVNNLPPVMRPLVKTISPLVTTAFAQKIHHFITTLTSMKTVILWCELCTAFLQTSYS